MLKIPDLIKAAFPLAVLPLLCVFAGCGARVGSVFEQTPDGVKSTNASPNRIDLAVNGEHWTSESVTGTRYVRVYDSADAVGMESIGPNSRVFALPTPAGVLKVASDSDTTIRVEEFTSGTTTVKGLELSTSASEPIRASNEALDRLVAYWASRDEASRQVLIEQVKAIDSGLGKLLEAVVQLAAPVPVR